MVKKKLKIKSLPKPETSNNEASRKSFVDYTRLEEIALIKAAITVNEKLVHQTGQVNIRIGLKPEFDADKSGDSQLTVYLTVNADGNSDEKESIFSLEANYRAMYLIDKNYELGDTKDPSDEVKHFINRNVLIHVWPYVREFVDQLSRKTPLQPVVLPMTTFAFPQLYIKKS